MTSPWNQHCANSIVSAHFRSLYRYGDRKSAPLCGSAAVARAFQCHPRDNYRHGADELMG